MHTSLKTAYLDNIYYKLRSNAGQLIALGMYLNIQDTPHETAFLLEGELFSIQSQQWVFFPLCYITAHCAFDLIHDLRIKSRS